MNYYAAPMEGLTDRVWRQAHQKDVYKRQGTISTVHFLPKQTIDRIFNR